MAAPKKPVATKKAPAKKAETKQPSIADLHKQALELRREAVDLKRGMHVGEVQNVRAYIAKRRDLARLLTALNKMKAEGEEK